MEDITRQNRAEAEWGGREGGREEAAELEDVGIEPD